MSTLDELKAAHPHIENVIGYVERRVPLNGYETAIAALLAKAREDEARIKMLEQARDDWKSRHDCLDRQGFKVSRELDAERSARQALEAKLEEADEALLSSYHHDGGISRDFCGSCANAICDGHASDCPVPAALSRRVARGHETGEE